MIMQISLIKAALLRKLLIVTLLFLSSCSGKKEQLLFVMQAGDINKSCIALNNDIKHIEEYEIKKLKTKQKINIARNTTMFSLAIPTFFTSLLFVDFSGDTKDKIEIYKQRIRFLQRLKETKNC